MDGQMDEFERITCAASTSYEERVGRASVCATWSVPEQFLCHLLLFAVVIVLFILLLLNVLYFFLLLHVNASTFFVSHSLPTPS